MSVASCEKVSWARSKLVWVVAALERNLDAKELSRYDDRRGRFADANGK